METYQENASEINIAGWSKMSTVDWPDEVVTTLFLQGCPLRCNYCHNFEILDPKAKGEVSFEKDVIPHLKNRVKLLDGVVFSGGEPLMQANSEDGGLLYKAMKEVKEINHDYKIGLHTAGSYPKNLRRVLDLVDWVGFDIKANNGKVDSITNVKGSESLLKESLEILLETQENRRNTQKPLNIQFRTTVDKTVLSDIDVTNLQDELRNIGINELILQEVRSIGAPPEYAIKLAQLSNKG